MQEGKEELFEEGGEAGVESGDIGVSEPDPLAAGVGAGDELDAAQGKAQGIGQQAAAGSVRLALDRRGGDRDLKGPVPDPDDCIPAGPGPDENREKEIRTPDAEI
jgi:hypothetical protein